MSFHSGFSAAIAMAATRLFTEKELSVLPIRTTVNTRRYCVPEVNKEALGQFGCNSETVVNLNRFPRGSVASDMIESEILNSFWNTAKDFHHDLRSNLGTALSIVWPQMYGTNQLAHLLQSKYLYIDYPRMVFIANMGRFGERFQSMQNAGSIHSSSALSSPFSLEPSNSSTYMIPQQPIFYPRKFGTSFEFKHFYMNVIGNLFCHLSFYIVTVNDETFITVCYPFPEMNTHTATRIVDELINNISTVSDSSE